MHFDYDPVSIMTLVFCGFAGGAILWRFNKGINTRWVFVYWFLLLWFNSATEGPWHLYGILGGLIATCLLLFEFHAGFVSRAFMTLEGIGLLYVIWAGVKGALKL